MRCACTLADAGKTLSDRVQLRANVRKRARTRANTARVQTCARAPARKLRVFRAKTYFRAKFCAKFIDWVQVCANLGSVCRIYARRALSAPRKQTKKFSNRAFSPFLRVFSGLKCITRCKEMVSLLFSSYPPKINDLYCKNHTFSKKNAQSVVSQTQRESQALSNDSSEETQKAPVEDLPNGTVYFSNDFSSFQDFSAFQYKTFQMNNNQFSTESFQEEHIFQTGFLGPQDSSSFL